jgi:hypothetical protein
MPRRLDPCIFCDCLPCECEGVASKKRAIKKTANLDIKSAMKTATASESQPAVIKPGLAIQAMSSATSETEDEFARCINVLAEILHVDELAKYSYVLTPATRAKLWRCKNG